MIVLGAGSGGLAAAKRAASHGARVAIIEGDRVGGTCVIRGCVPKKLLVYGSQYGEYLKHAPSFGVDISEAKINTATLLGNIRSEVDRLNKLHIDLLAKANVELIKGWGYISNPNLVSVKVANGVSPLELAAKNILIAVGGRPQRLDIPGSSLAWVSDDVFMQKSFPEKVVVIGAGFIACEFACILNGLGVEVTQLVRGNKLLKGFDREIVSTLQEMMLSKGINIHFATNVTALKGEIGNLTLSTSKGKNIKSGAVLFAIGRKPFLEGLDLTGMNLVADNKILVDKHHRTNVSSIFAVGDVTNRINLTPVAIEEGRVLADNLFAGKNRHVNYDFVPKAVFSQPELAFVGITEEEALDKYGEDNIVVFRSKFRPMSQMLPKSTEICLLKLIVDRKTSKIIGCHMIGEHASEIIQMAAVSIQMGAKKSDFDKTMALHPTIAEEFVTMA
ncbi:Glutathione reductase [Prochlorococcus sp. MIT 0602]|nr:Glutathione reductase [Prochlorococcus sp. MIT 0602]